MQLTEGEIELEEKNIKFNIIGKSQWKVVEQYVKELETSVKKFYTMAIDNRNK